MKTVNIINKKAKYDYEFLESYTCGIVLYGKEVKAIRNGNCSLSGSYCYISTNNEVILKDSYIKNDIKKGQFNDINFNETRERKLLLNKKEIRQIKEYTSQKGFTLVPYKIFSYKGLLKVELKVCKGKKDYDKRESIKERDSKRELNRIQKNYR